MQRQRDGVEYCKKRIFKIMIKTYTLKKLDIEIKIIINEIGNDLCVIIFGGDMPHIGCVTLSQPRPSLMNESVISSTTSIINIIGHKDDIIARYASEKLSSSLNKNVVVSCGVHVDNIKDNEIDAIIAMAKELTELIISDFD